jgi:two-component system sensor histidine kinase KdpD
MRARGSSRYPGGLRARFDGDAVGRILQNLLDNAEKYARGSADRTIHVSARAAGGCVEAAVADHGPGLRRGDARRLFQPFRRGHDAGGDRPPGLGLGLALARSLARAQDGDLVVRVTPGGGATFVLTLPSA